MAIKAIAMDIDGTLTNDQKVISPRTREKLLATQESGIKLILASGRPAWGLHALAQEAGVPLLNDLGSGSLVANLAWGKNSTAYQNLASNDSCEPPGPICRGAECGPFASN